MTQPETALSEVSFAVVDVETTGLSPAQGDRIIEIALVRREPDGSREGWSRLVDPGRPIPPRASKVHGILDDHLLGAPAFAGIKSEGTLKYPLGELGG